MKIYKQHFCRRCNKPLERYHSKRATGKIFPGGTFCQSCFDFLIKKGAIIPAKKRVKKEVMKMKTIFADILSNFEKALIIYEEFSQFQCPAIPQQIKLEIQTILNNLSFDQICKLFRQLTDTIVCAVEELPIPETDIDNLIDGRDFLQILFIWHHIGDQILFREDVKKYAPNFLQ